LSEDRGRVVQRSGASCLKIGGELPGANCPGGELSGYPIIKTLF